MAVTGEYFLYCVQKILTKLSDIAHDASEEQSLSQVQRCKRSLNE